MTRRTTARPATLVALAAAVTVGSAVARLPQGRTDLVTAVGADSPLRARVSGGFLPPGNLGPHRSASTQNYALLTAAAKTLDRARSGDAEARSDLGVAHLLLGNLDAGISALEYQRVERPEDARVHADLSAGYIERAERDDQPEDFARAYDSACRALELEPGLSEALFNRAVALEGLALTWLSPLAWNELLAREPTVEWGRRALDRLVETTARETGRQAKDRAREALRMNLAQASIRDLVEQLERFPELAHDAASKRVLPGVARWRLGDRSAAALSPNEAAEAIRVIDRLQGGPGTTLAFRSILSGDQGVAHAQIEFARIRTLLDERRFAEAAVALRAIGSVFRRANSPYELWVSFHRAVTDYRIGNTARLGTRFEEIEQRARGVDQELAAQTLWMQSLVAAGASGGLIEARRAQREAEAIFDALGNRQRAAELAGRQAATLAMMGDTRAAWRYAVTDFQGQTLATPARRRYASLSGTAFELVESGLRSAARDLARLTVPTADAAGAFESGDIRKEILRAAASDQPLDPRLLAEAVSALDRIGDPDVRAHFEADLALAEAMARLRRGEAPVASAQRAANAFQESRVGTLGSQSLFVLGRALKRAGRGEEGRVATARAFDELRRRQADRGTGRVSADAQQAIEEAAADLVEGLIEAGKAVEALEIVRSIEEVVPAAPTLRPDRVAVVFFGRGKATEVWVSGRGKTRHRTLELDGPARRSIASRYRLALEMGQPEDAARLLEDELYPKLMAPLDPWAFEPESNLVIVPPRDLHGIPFGLLRSHASAPRLLDRVTLWYASSIGRAFDGDLSPPRLDTALVVGDPVFADEDAGLDRLPESRKEAEEAAAAHRRSLVLTGAAAERGRVIRALNGQSVVHFATHGVTNPVNPGLSYIVLGGTPGRTGRLYASDPVWSRFRGTRLVVLSACHGTTDRAATSGAALGLVRAIADAGVDNVIASTGRTADHAARVLMRHVHAGLAKGLSSGEALRRAQQRAILELGPEAERDIGSFRAFL